MDSFTFWTIATNKEDLDKAQYLRKSLSNYGYNDFHILSNINSDEDYILHYPSLNTDHVLHKLKYLSYLKNEINYNYYIFIDNNSIINYKPNIEKYLKHNFFSILEFQLNNKDNEHFEWNGYPIISIYDIMKDNGILIEDIFTANNNLFICRKSMIDQVLNIAYIFNNTLSKYNFILNENIIFAYVIQMLIVDNSRFLASNNKDFYGDGNGKDISFYNPLTDKIEYEYSPSITTLEKKYAFNNY
jgi:hypothetical protein